jgi:cobalt-zinc-cadmium efflux system protein
LHAHEHAHEHTLAPASSKAQRRLVLTIAVTVGILLLEVVGGIMANSLALLSDAGHVFTDLLALLISLITIRIVARPASSSKTFGFHRMEILSALINGVALVVISLFIFYEAYLRLRSPETVRGLEVFVVATLGLIGNGIGVFLLRDAGENMNIRGAFLHLVGDAVSSVGVILSGIIILLTGWVIVDPLVSIGIGVLIIFGAARLISEAVNVLLEGTPPNIDMQEVVGAIMTVPGVCSVHDLHIWCLTPQLCSMSGHVILDPDTGIPSRDVLAKISQLMDTDYGIQHTTIQVEEEHCGRDDHEWLAVK